MVQLLKELNSGSEACLLKLGHSLGLPLGANLNIMFLCDLMITSLAIWVIMIWLVRLLFRRWAKVDHGAAKQVIKYWSPYYAEKKLESLSWSLLACYMKSSLVKAEKYKWIPRLTTFIKFLGTGNRVEQKNNPHLDTCDLLGYWFWRNYKGYDFIPVLSLPLNKVLLSSLHFLYKF